MNNNILLHTDTTFEPHLYELRQLPFIVHRRKRYLAGKGCHSNFHRNIELLCFLEGSGTVYCGEEAYPVAPGDIVIANSYVAHRIVAKEDITFDCLIPGSDFCEESGINIALRSFDAKISDPQTLVLFTTAMGEYDQQDELWQARVRCSVLNLLIHLCRHHSAPRTSPVTEDSAFQSVINAVGYMRQNMQKKLTVEQIAEEAGFSKYYFLRLFKRVTGCTVVQYLNLLRCEYAKELLRSGNHSVKETALLCGFENLSYFTGVFKKCTGYLPNAYRTQGNRPR